MPVSEDLALVLQELRSGRVLRGYFINTLFDGTFVILGAIVSSAFLASGDGGHVARDTIKAMVILATSVGMASSISIYEAEALESEIRIGRIAQAMLRSMEDTAVERASRITKYATALINFLAPFLTLSITVIPFLLVPPGILSAPTAAYVAIGLAIVIIFTVGIFIGRSAKVNPLLQGLRMALVGVGAFLITSFIERGL